MLSKELTIKCFPHKESVLFNIDLCLQILGATESEPDRIESLCRVHQSLRDNNILDAIEKTRRAGYILMAQAIALHWLGDIDVDSRKV